MTTPLLCGDLFDTPSHATTGCLVRFKHRPREILMLTAMHAIVPSYDLERDPNSSPRGRVITDSSGHPIGVLSAWSGYKTDTTIDAALVWIDPARIGPSLRTIGTLGQPQFVARAGMTVRIARGPAGTVQGSANVPLTAQGPNWSADINYQNQIVCSRFTQDGDSGAIVVDDKNDPIGMVVGVHDQLGTFGPVTVVAPIAAILLKDNWKGSELEIVTEIPTDAIAPSFAPPPPSLEAASTDPQDVDTARAHLHPLMRAAVAALEGDLAHNNVPLILYEGFRTPERQRFLWNKDHGPAGEKIGAAFTTNANAWSSYHQYGLAADFIIQSPGHNGWDTTSPESKQWWDTYHRLAAARGLERISQEECHVQYAGLRIADLKAGTYPPGGDASWAGAVAAAIERSTDQGTPPKPAIGPLPTRPTLPDNDVPAALKALSWAGLPRVADLDFHQYQNGGDAWRVDKDGITLEDARAPLRSPGAPLTCGAIVAAYGDIIAEASKRHSVPPELIIMTIATETGIYRSTHFTGSPTFRWEGTKNQYSAGPMQVIQPTALAINRTSNLGYDPADFPPYPAEPNPIPENLRMYDAKVSIDIGTAYIAGQEPTTKYDPILVAAAYNHGSLAPRPGALFNLFTYPGHLQRASEFYGDACAVLQSYGR